MEGIATRLDRVIGGVGRLDVDSFEFRTTGLAGALFRRKSFKAALTAVRKVEWVARSSRLTMHLDGGDVIPLQGPAAAVILTALRAMGIGEAERAPGTPLHEVTFTSNATVVRGPVHFKGHLSLGGGGLYWESAGSVEQLVGVEGLSLSTGEISALESDSDGLRVTDREGVVHRLLMDSGERLRDALQDAVLAEALPDEESSPVHADAVVRFGAVFHPLESPSRQIGTIEVLPSGELHMIPHTGPAAYTVAPVDIQRLAYGPEDALDSGVLVVPAQSGELVGVRPRGSLVPLSAVLAFSRTLPVIDAIPPSSIPMLRQAKGEVASVRSESPMDSELSLVPATLVHLPEGIGILMPDGIDWTPEPGTRLRLLLGLGRTVIQVTGRYVGTEEHVREDELPGWPRTLGQGRLLVLAILDRDAVVRLPSRRETFRVVASEAAEVREMDFRPKRGLRPVGPRIEGRLVNLSIGGCALLLRQAWPTGTVFSYHLPVDDDGEDVEMELEVIHSSQAREEDETWHKHGMRFRDLSERDERALAQEIRRREVASAAS